MTELAKTLEGLVTRYEELVGRHYRGTLELRGQAEKYEADLQIASNLRDKLRTGRLVPAQSATAAMTSAKDAEIARLREALGTLNAEIDKARDRVPDDDEGLAASLFCHNLNSAQQKAMRALAERKEAP